MGSGRQCNWNDALQGNHSPLLVGLVDKRKLPYATPLCHLMDLLVQAQMQQQQSNTRMVYRDGTVNYGSGGSLLIPINNVPASHHLTILRLGLLCRLPVTALGNVFMHGRPPS